LSVTETVLYFVVIPAGAVLVIAGLAVAGGGRNARRYRPGRSYDFTPVWFLSSPEQVASTQDTGEGSSAVALAGGRHSAELTAGPAGAGSERTGAPAPAGTTGGASDRW
jgi:hypothetical protein